MGKAKRKPRPQPAKWYWWDTDNCWDCNHPNNCNQCKRLKQQRAHEREKRKRDNGRPDSDNYKKKQGLIPIDSNNGIILETYVNFECLCRKCREKIPEKDYDIEKIKYCFNCGTRIDGKRANKIIKECKENVRGNFSELISVANKVCKECGECTPYPFSVEHCQYLKRKLLENTELCTRYRSVSVNSQTGLFCDEIIN